MGISGAHQTLLNVGAMRRARSKALPAPKDPEDPKGPSKDPKGPTGTHQGPGRDPVGPIRDTKRTPFLKPRQTTQNSNPKKRTNLCIA
jgi:hypothetical protein